MASANAEAERQKNHRPYINYKANGKTILFKTDGTQIQLIDDDDTIYLFNGTPVKFEGIGMEVNTSTGRVIDQNGLKSLTVRKIENNEIINIYNKNLDLIISPPSSGAQHGGGKRKTTRKTSKNKKSKKVKSRKIRKMRK